MTKGELAGYRMDLEEFRHRSQMAGLLTEQMEKALDNASRAVRISRLQATKDSLRREMRLFYGKYDQDLSDHLQKQFSDTYAATISQLGLRPVLKLPGIDADLPRLDTVIRKPWAVDGLTFSQRLWKDQNLVVNTLHQTLTRQVALSLPPDEAVKALVTAFPEKSMRSAIGRLVMTESNAIATAGNQEAYKATGVKQYEIVATLDSHTSAICQEMDGKRFPISKMEVGVTAPPFHPWCRTTTAPYDPDFEGILPPEKRAARDGDGRTYLTGARTYKEWVADNKRGYQDKENSQKFSQEQGVKVSKKKIKNTLTVDRQLVNSKAYHDKFDTLDFNKKTREKLYSMAKEILEHRDSTDLEDFIILDVKTGAEVAANRDAKIGGKVGLSKKDFEKVVASDNGVVLLHNHPLNGRFSYADIKNAFSVASVKSSIVVGHNGEVHIMQNLRNTEKLEDFYKKAYNELKALGLPEKVAEAKALDYIYEKGDFFDYEKR